MPSDGVLYFAGEAITNARRLVESLREARRDYPAEWAQFDPRAIALVVTKLEEAELWMTKVRI